MEIRFLYALFIFYGVVGFVDGGGDWAGAWFAEASAHDFVGGHDDHEGVFVDVVGDAFDFGYLLPQMYSNYFFINNPFIRYRENLCYQVRNSNWALICHFIFS